MAFQFVERFKLQPLLTSADIVAAATASSYIDLTESHWATFLVKFGAITASTATVTVECSTAGSSNATEGAVPFRYRLSGAVNTDSMGAITAATSDGASIAATDDNKTLVIDLDPATIPSNLSADHRYARVVITPASDMSAFVVGVDAVLLPRYPGNSINSAT